MSLLFNMLSRLIIAFLPRSKHLNFMATVTICNDFGALKIKSVTVSIVNLKINKIKKLINKVCYYFHC